MPNGDSLILMMDFYQTLTPKQGSLNFPQLLHRLLLTKEIMPGLPQNIFESSAYTKQYSHSVHRPV